MDIYSIINEDFSVILGKSISKVEPWEDDAGRISSLDIYFTNKNILRIDIVKKDGKSSLLATLSKPESQKKKRPAD